jgi:hypothetical protein
MTAKSNTLQDGKKFEYLFDAPLNKVRTIVSSSELTPEKTADFIANTAVKWAQPDKTLCGLYQREKHRRHLPAVGKLRLSLLFLRSRQGKYRGGKKPLLRLGYTAKGNRLRLYDLVFCRYFIRLRHYKCGKNCGI